MALNCHRDIWITPQPIGLPRQYLLCFGGDVGAVEREKYAVTGTRF
jgi:hypothetical protein